MDWTESLKRAIDFIELHLLDDITAKDVAEQVNISLFYFHEGFSIMTGFSISEYIRCRRLYLSALDIISGDQKVIDIAYKYGYDTPESFTKAFTRFHGISPSALRRDKGRIRTFLPLKISVNIQGGNDMDCKVEKMNGFKIIGFERSFTYKDAYKEIPKFWDELFKPLYFKENRETELEKAVIENCIGEFGVCIDDCAKDEFGKDIDRLHDEKFRYIIGGRYKGGAVPDGMTVYEFPDMLWAKFSCTGPMPGALQDVNTRISKEWLPGNPDFEIALSANIERYDKGDSSLPDYKSEIWIPVKRK